MKYRMILGTILTVMLISILLIGVSELPRFSDPSDPANNEVVQRYSEHSIEETHSLNVVTAIVLDYRGFDTLIEATVLFCAFMCILVTLMVVKH